MNFGGFNPYLVLSPGSADPEGPTTQGLPPPVDPITPSQSIRGGGPGLGPPGEAQYHGQHHYHRLQTLIPRAEPPHRGWEWDTIHRLRVTRTRLQV